MTVILKSNDNFTSSNIQLPLPPEGTATDVMKSSVEMEIYARFMRHLRLVPNGKAEIKVLSAIQFTADMLDMGDAIVSKTLVDMGLRAPRHSFPAEYLNFIDSAMQRNNWQVGSPSNNSIALEKYWNNGVKVTDETPMLAITYLSSTVAAET